MYQRILTELCMNRFEWKGLPDSGDPRNIERNLFYRALAVYFHDEKTGKDLILEGSPYGQLNYNDQPTHFVIGAIGYQGDILSATGSKPDCVPIWANYMRLPDLDIVMEYSYLLAELHTTIGINSRNARQTKVMQADQNGRFSAANINRMIDEGQSVIPVNAPLGEMFTVLDLGINPLILEQLPLLKTRIWSECMTMLGIDNSNQDKKERLVSDEVQANNGQIEASRRVNLNARQEAAARINDRFGTNISVDYYTEVGPEDQESEEDDASVHDGTMESN